MERASAIAFFAVVIAVMLIGGSCQNTNHGSSHDEHLPVAENTNAMVDATPNTAEPAPSGASPSDGATRNEVISNEAATEPTGDQPSMNSVSEKPQVESTQSAAPKPPVGTEFPEPEKVIQPFPHVRVNLTTREVQFDAMVCLDEGWLEQIVCTPNSREHETLMVTEVRPSNLHAAMLLAKYEAGSPGRWKYENDTYSVIPPTGTAVTVSVRYKNDCGETIEHPVNQWVRDHLGRHEFPARPWVFGGSQIEQNPEFMGPGEHYVADMSGSVIGLVTFGDELLGWRDVLADQATVSPPEWEANGRAMPPVGTPVTVILRPVAE